MLDKLEMRSRENIDHRSLKDLLTDFQISFVPDNQYRSCFICKKNGTHLLTIKSNPSPYFKNVHPLKVLANPNKWESFDKLILTLSIFCQPSDLEISRIDHAVDIHLSLEEVHRGLRIKYKMKSDRFLQAESFDRGRLTGFMIGKQPELYCIYDKGYQLNGRKLVRLSSTDFGILTRIELRQNNKKVKYPNLSEIFNYIDDPPFNALEFYEIEDNSSSSKILDMREKVYQAGLNNCYHTLNRQNNFKRDFKKLFKPNDFKLNLERDYKEGLSKFLGI